ncbi:ParA family protein [Muricoccus radiodurans]|uniref:ParA family protein n=1 Tax=Muricoccus radiodurans TaxID=2231721 RepID=UPI003CF538BA
MGRIITVASGKGGTAKSSLTMTLSATLAAMGYRVAVIDADPNACFAQWHGIYEGAPFDCMAEVRQDEIVDQAQAQAADHDVVLIDTAGFGNTTAAFAAGTADYVLVPVMPDRASAVEAMRMVRQVGSFAKASRREIPVALVRARWNAKGLVERAVLADLEAANAPVLDAFFADLSDFGKLTLSGRVPTTGKIAQQTEKMIAELIGLGAVPAKPTKKAKAA